MLKKPLVFLLVLIVLFLVFIGLATSRLKPETGCAGSNDYIIAGFDGSCAGDGDAVYNIPAAYDPVCWIQPRETLTRRPSSDSYVLFSIPAKDLGASTGSSKNVTIEIRRASCMHGGPTALVRAFMKDSKIAPHLVEKKKGHFEVGGIDSYSNKFARYDEEEKKHVVWPINSPGQQGDKFDLFFTRDDDGNVGYIVKCYHWNGECHADIDKDYLAGVSYAIELAPYTHEIMPKAIALTEASRLK